MRRRTTTCLWVMGAAGLLLVACSDDAKNNMGDPCAHNSDCKDEICHVGVCASKNPLKGGEACSHNAACRSFNCKDGICGPGLRALGDPCRFDVECVAGECRIEGSFPGLCVDDAPKPDGALPDAGVDGPLPDMAPREDAAPPDMPKPDMAQPDTLSPDTLSPDTLSPDTLSPDTLAHDTLSPDTMPPDLGPCGGKDERCCGGICNAPMTCVADKCVCGAKDQPCCAGDVCDTNLTCLSGTSTCGCGGFKQACCNGTTCNGTLECAGTACACIKAIDGTHYVRSDGTVWYQDYPGVNRAVGPMLNAIQVVHTGHNFACGLRSTGTVWCWSKNNVYGNQFGQLADGTFVTPSVDDIATQVKVSSSTFLTGVTSISATGSFTGYGGTTCAVKSDTSVWCWGHAQSGALFQEPSASSSNKSFATQIKASSTAMLTGATQVAVNNKHACAVVGGGSMACWGANNLGQLGTGGVATHQYPQLVTIPSKVVKKVSAGVDFSCALTTVGDVYCWGSNDTGQCGQTYASSAIPSPSPVAQTGGGYLTGVKEIAVGNDMACAVKTDGTLWCWGRWPSSNHSATQILDQNSVPIDDAVLVTTVHHNYRILRSNGEYYMGVQGSMSYNCP